MGAQEFFDVIRTDKSLKVAFKACVKQALYDYGHAGYTGTIAEKGEVVLMGEVSSFEEAEKLADEFMEKSDARIDDKWGPAGAIKVPGQGFLFFGWASS